MLCKPHSQKSSPDLFIIEFLYSGHGQATTHEKPSSKLLAGETVIQVEEFNSKESHRPQPLQVCLPEQEKNMSVQKVTKLSELNSTGCSVWFPENPAIQQAARKCCDELIDILRTNKDTCLIPMNHYVQTEHIYNAKYGDIRHLTYSGKDCTLLLGCGLTEPPEPKGSEITVMSSQYFATTKTHGPTFINKRRFGKGAGVLHRFDLAPGAKDALVLNIPDRQVLRQPLKMLFEKYFAKGQPLRSTRALSLIQDLEKRSFGEGQTLKGNAIRFFFDMFRIPGYSSRENTEILLPNSYIDDSSAKTRVLRRYEGKLIWKKMCGYIWTEGEPVDIIAKMQKAVKHFTYIRVVDTNGVTVGGYRAPSKASLKHVVDHFQSEGFTKLQHRFNNKEAASLTVADLARQQGITPEYGEECVLEVVKPLCMRASKSF